MSARWLASRSLLWQFSVGSFVAIVVIGVILALILGETIRHYAVEELMDEAQGSVREKVVRQISPGDLTRPMVGQRYDSFHQFVQASVVSQRTARIKIWSRDGTVVYSNEPAQVGQVFPIKEELADALAGRVAGELSELQSLENAQEKTFGRLLEVYTPIVFPGSSEVAGAFEIYQYYDPTARFIEGAQRYTYAGLSLGLVILYLSLFAIVKKGADTIRRQQGELRLRAAALENAYESTLEALCASLDMRDRETEGHSRRVSQMTVALAREVGVPEVQMKPVEYGALLHDIGKIGVSDAILLKPGPLTDDEWAQMRGHAALGYQMLSNIKFLKGAAEMVRAHHERYDGSGYPAGLAGRDVPLGARIFAVIDTYDAMTTDRPYRKALSHREAVEEIRRNSGAQFDPQVVQAFQRVFGAGSPGPQITVPAAPRRDVLRCEG